MKTHTTYECETCGQTSAHADVARACEAVPVTRVEGVQPGDIVYSAGEAYGWSGGTEWFHEYQYPNPISHHQSAVTGYPTYVVLDIGLYRDLARSHVVGRRAHTEVVRGWTPLHPQDTFSRADRGRETVIDAELVRPTGRSVTPEQLAEYRAQADAAKKGR